MRCLSTLLYFPFFFFYDPATTEIYTLSLHDALPIFGAHPRRGRPSLRARARPQEVGDDDRVRLALPGRGARAGGQDRKSTRLNSSHSSISYAVFCLKKKKKNKNIIKINK